MRIAIITGASSGIGFEFLKQVRRFGYDEIWIIARREERLKKIHEKIENTRIFAVDLANGCDAIKNALDTMKPEIGLLINAAGFGKLGSFSEHSTTDTLGMIDVNVRALTQMTKIALPYMMNGGRVIQVASSAAFLPQPGFAVYAATKSYVYSFSKALNQELKPRNITVTALCPGPTKTEFFNKAETYHKQASYKKFFYEETRKVVRKALMDSKHRKSESVSSPAMKMLKYAGRLLPQTPIIALAGKMCKNERNK